MERPCRHIRSAKIGGGLTAVSCRLVRYILVSSYPIPLRPRRWRWLPILALNGLLCTAGAVATLFLSGAAPTTESWNEDPSALERHKIWASMIAAPQGIAPRPIAIATPTNQVEQVAALSTIVFDGPTDLGVFSSGSPHAPILANQFAMSTAQALKAVPERAPMLIAEASMEPPAIPLPPANPFRLETPEPAAVASKRLRAAARPQQTNQASTPTDAPEEPGLLHRLFGFGERRSEPALAYAPVETDSLNGWPAPPKRSVVGERTAIYDISTKTVSLPNGRRLEAHSGLGEFLDDPRSMHVKSRGVTPPNVYSLRLRESLFHGVRAIRLVPVNENKMFGRDGILAHTYMLGERGDSNGCVSFKDYDAFLNAFLNGEVTRLIVTENASALLALATETR